MLRVSFPPPDRPVLGIDDGSDVHEATFREYARRCVRLRARVRPDEAHARVVACKMNQRARRLRRVSPALTRRYDAIGDLDHPRGVRCALEPRAPDDFAAFLLYNEEAMAPRVGAIALPRGGAQRLEPHGRHLPGHVKPPQSIGGAATGRLLRSTPPLDQHAQTPS